MFSQLKAFFHKTSKLFFHWTPWDQLIHPRLKTHIFIQILWKNFSPSIGTCLFMILHENLILWSHVQIFSFWSKFHLPQMKLVVQHVCQVCEFWHFLNYDSHEKQQKSLKHLKIYILAPINLSKLLTFELYYCDSSPSLATSRWQSLERW